jgi:hypothetical protein
MINANPGFALFYDTQQQWSRILNDPLDRLGAIKRPRLFIALDLNRVIRDRPRSLSFLLRKSAVKVNTIVFLVRYGNRRAEHGEHILGEIFRTASLVKTMSDRTWHIDSPRLTEVVLIGPSCLITG